MLAPRGPGFESQWYLSGPFVAAGVVGPVGGGTSLGVAACWWLLSILGSGPNDAGISGVVGIAFLEGQRAIPLETDDNLKSELMRPRCRQTLI